MSNDTEELPRDAWQDTLDELTQAHVGEAVTIELVGQVGDQIEVDELPLVYVEYDHQDDVVVVAVREPDRADPVLRHIIEHPQRIFVHPGEPEVAQALDVVAGDGTQSLITLQR